MAKLTLFPNGAKIAQGPKFKTSTPATRGEISGWSRSALNRNADFLRSVDFSGGVPPCMFACTFTIRDCPETPEDFANLIYKVLFRFRRMGFITYHWVIEWALRSRYPEAGSVPHLHMILILDRSMSAPISFGGHIADAICHAWLDVSAEYGSNFRAQHVAYIGADWVGWFAYVAKHAARGASHAQRSADVPKNWRKTGRLWGKGGQWVTAKSEYEIGHQAFFDIRRVMLRHAIARCKQDLRKNDGEGYHYLRKWKAAKRRLRYLKAVLQCPKSKSECVPLNEWGDSKAVARYIAVRYVQSGGK